jgi:hypothetical protein
MMAALLAYTHLAPTDYEGKPYFALNFGAGIPSLCGFTAGLWVIAFLTWTLRGETKATACLARLVMLGSGFIPVKGGWCSPMPLPSAADTLSAHRTRHFFWSLPFTMKCNILI